jgi:hypothetical protein
LTTKGHHEKLQVAMTAQQTRAFLDMSLKGWSSQVS